MSGLVHNFDEAANRCEEKAMRILAEQYDRVVNINGKQVWKKIGIPQTKRLNQHFNRQTGMEPASIGFYFRKGVPDVLAFSWNGDELDYKFVEVKKSGTSVRESQVLWMTDFSELNSEIWYIDDGDTHGLVNELDAPFIEDKFFPYRYKDYTTIKESAELDTDDKIRLPEWFKLKHDLEPGDDIKIREHSDTGKLVIEPAESPSTN